ncbi:ECF RNA polymerase sigma factor SigH [Lachnospiraceae bacterium]|nr:RNA polymerase sigma factor [Lachnospiraceae bacterium]GFH91203.1 ECF RNA polymerase sigma factor SigH [Lachnospiraceae bacterium]
MNNDEFERFVLKFGKDILRFCRMTAGDAENGNELYQDTMLKLLEKKKRLDSMQNTKSYALSTSIYLWKNKKKKYANRMRLVPMDSMDEMSDEGYAFTDYGNEASPEHIILKQNEVDIIQGFVKTLPEKYRIPIYLYYSADMQIKEISKILGLPEGTVKSRMRKAKKQLKEKLEAIGYDR